jgi:hypothetical protein
MPTIQLCRAVKVDPSRAWCIPFIFDTYPRENLLAFMLPIRRFLQEGGKDSAKEGRVQADCSRFCPRL